MNHRKTYQNTLNFQMIIRQCNYINLLRILQHKWKSNSRKHCIFSGSPGINEMRITGVSTPVFTYYISRFPLFLRLQFCIVYHILHSVQIFSIISVSQHGIKYHRPFLTGGTYCLFKYPFSQRKSLSSIVSTEKGFTHVSSSAIGPSYSYSDGINQCFSQII